MSFTGASGWNIMVPDEDGWTSVFRRDVLLDGGGLLTKRVDVCFGTVGAYYRSRTTRLSFFSLHSCPVIERLFGK